ncbi:MAG TPA: UPF0175 family protein [Saprospiraceae bacterium]|nr:UPF0175 family protein [Saprospiraceae bacterium]HMP24289.1 UPF0175 family protein [Saprospiraceae bacterium]
MVIELEDDILAQSNLTVEEIRLGIALWLFQEKEMSLGKCAKIAGMHKIAFQQELAKRQIEIHYTDEDFQRDLESLKYLP